MPSNFKHIHLCHFSLTYPFLITFILQTSTYPIHWNTCGQPRSTLQTHPIFHSYLEASSTYKHCVWCYCTQKSQKSQSQVKRFSVVHCYHPRLSIASFGNLTLFHADRSCQNFFLKSLWIVSVN